MAGESAQAGQSSSSPIRLEVGARTSVGQVRTGNEDSVLCEPIDSPVAQERGLFCAVADGMGGHAAGEVASALAVQKTRDMYYGAESNAVDRALRTAIESANNEVFAAGSNTSGRDHMGSTMTAAVVMPDRAVVGHVGDSRCYLIRGGEIQQLTRDHSWVAEEVEAGVLTPEEARVHPRRNIITRALGLRPDVEVDIYEAELEAGSMLVLCSDGLHGPVRDEEILAYTSRLPPQQAVDELIALANERGGPDNISAVVVKLGALDEPETLREAPISDDEWTPPAMAAHDEPRAEAASKEEEAPTPPLAAAAAHPESPAPPAAAAASPGPEAPAERAEPPQAAVGPPAEVAPSREGGMSWTAVVVVALLLLLGIGAGLGWWLFRTFDLPTGVGSGPSFATQPPAVAPTAAATPAPAVPATAPPPAVSTPTPPSATPAPVPTPTPERLATVAAVATIVVPLIPGVPAIETQVAGGFTRATPIPTALGSVSQDRVLEVVEEGSRVHSAPRLDAPVVCQLHHGDKIVSDAHVDGEPITDNPRWYHVKALLEGSEPCTDGYVSGTLVTILRGPP